MKIEAKAKEREEQERHDLIKRPLSGEATIKLLKF
jgi:hypothetical protein